MSLTGEKTVAQQESPAFTAVICQETAAVCARVCGHTLRALVLTGSLARDEGTFVSQNERHRLLGDAEFFLVTANSSRLPAETDIRGIRDEIESGLRERGISCHVDLSPVDSKFLGSLPHRILTYELKKCGRVIAGDPGVLSLIPEFEPIEILWEDAWRLLANRIAEQLDAVAWLPPRPTELSDSLYYRTVKLYLDMATSLLVFLGAYEPSYRARARQLSHLVADPEFLAGGALPLPFPLAPFNDVVQVCTDVKLAGFVPGGNSAGIEPSFDFWQRAVGHARRLWRWELQQLAGPDESLLDSDLLEKYACSRPIRERLRGWAYAARACGWIRGCHRWPRWMVLCGRSSPRYLVYSAASNLFFHLPCLLMSEQPGWPGGTSRRRCASLPVEEAKGLLRWRDRATDIAMNYHRFVEGTRA